MENQILENQTNSPNNPLGPFERLVEKLSVGKLILIILLQFCLFLLVLFLITREKVNLESVEPVISVTPTVELSTPTPEITQAEIFIPTSLPTLIPTKAIIPTTAPTNTPVPVPTATPTPTPTPRIPNPPIINITYPSEMQDVVFTRPDQNFCVVDVPAGGDTSSLQRKHSINDGGWSSYADIFTLCFEPREGLNRFQVQYKNKYGDESTVYTRQFNFHRVVPTPTISPL